MNKTINHVKIKQTVKTENSPIIYDHYEYERVRSARIEKIVYLGNQNVN